jgi:hypothetical protein
MYSQRCQANSKKYESAIIKEDSEADPPRLYNIKPVVVLAVAVIILFASFLPNIYAGGPRNDWLTDYNNIPVK